jgi:hypothetical protein
LKIIHKNDFQWHCFLVDGHLRAFDDAKVHLTSCLENRIFCE